MPEITHSFTTISELSQELEANGATGIYDASDPIIAVGERFSGFHLDFTSVPHKVRCIQYVDVQSDTLRFGHMASGEQIHQVRAMPNVVHRFFAFPVPLSWEDFRDGREG